MWVEPEYPHPFVPWAFSVCSVCGLDEDDPIPALCPHDYAVRCTTCPRAHTSDDTRPSPDEAGTDAERPHRPRPPRGSMCSPPAQDGRQVAAPGRIRDGVGTAPGPDTGPAGGRTAPPVPPPLLSCPPRAQQRARSRRTAGHVNPGA